MPAPPSRNAIGAYASFVAGGEHSSAQSASGAAQLSAPIIVYQLPNEGLLGSGAPTSMPTREMRAPVGGRRCIMLKRAAVLGLLAPLALANLSGGAAAAGWGPLAALMMLGNLSMPVEPGWRRGDDSHRAPYYPRHYGSFYGDGGFYRAPYYGGYRGRGSCGCGGYGNYGDYGGYVDSGGYGYDDYGW
jgi:hypothetical protein